MKKPRVIAEVGCNHKGDLELAKEFIKIAKIYAKADVVKFQKRDVETWAKRFPEQYNAPQMHMEKHIRSTEKILSSI